MNWDAIDWTALGRLRKDFLSGSAGGRDYWHSESDLASYDATFAQRIGWKWDYVLRELTRRGWVPPMGELLDWGCGSGIAGRAFLDHFGAQSVTALRVWDCSSAAMAFAVRRARGKYPILEVNTGSREDESTSGVTRPAFTLLVSHVLTELTSEQTEALMYLAARAQCVLWVEPGTHAVSRR